MTSQGGTNNDGVVFSYSVTGLGVEEISNDFTIVKVFPNPNNGIFTVSLSNINEKCSIEIYNILGEKVLTETLLPQTPKGALNEINLTGQPNGLYLYRVLTEDGSLVGEGKVIIE
jgi:hypothetical protein